MREPQSILITGASSGLGAALALAYARSGVRLALTGRDPARLGEVAARCRAAGAVVEAATLDICAREAVSAWVVAIDAAQPLDLVIANAGISGRVDRTAKTLESAEQAREIMAVNVDGALNTILPLIPAFVARRSGHFALMSSLAGFRGLPGAPAYCASKAALRSYGEGLRGDLMPHGVAVSVICPGFVRTPMTAVNPFPMPFLMDVDRAAAIIKRGLDRGQARIAFPWRLYALVRLLGALPPAWTDQLLTRLPKKR